MSDSVDSEEKVYIVLHVYYQHDLKYFDVIGCWRNKEDAQKFVADKRNHSFSSYYVSETVLK